MAVPKPLQEKKCELKRCKYLWERMIQAPGLSGWVASFEKVCGGRVLWEGPDAET